MMVIMPFASKIPGSPLIDRQITPVKIQTVHMLILTFAMPGVVEYSHKSIPKHCAGKKCTGKRMSADQKNNVYQNIQLASNKKMV